MPEPSEGMERMTPSDASVTAAAPGIRVRVDEADEMM